MFSALGGVAARGWGRLLRERKERQQAVTVALWEMYRVPDEPAESMGVKDIARGADDERVELIRDVDVRR